jgi:hypothetical protein
MARLSVTPELIVEINELYLKIGTYAGVSRQLGGSPSATTVKKYIIPNYVSKENIKIKHFKKEDIHNISFDIFKNVDNWGDLCILSDEEFEEVKDLWNELLI